MIEADSSTAVKTDADRIAFAKQIEDAADDHARRAVVDAYTGKLPAPAVTVENAEHVVLRSLNIRGGDVATGIGVQALVRFNAATDATIADCAIVGPAFNGVVIAEGSTVRMSKSLVAAVWSAGVLVDARGPTPASAVHLADGDIRNCYYTGVTLGSSDSTIETCRISGSAWHGIRYDNGSPTIRGNAIFGNARSGIYASGETTAVVRENLFWRNEMDGMSCWSNNADNVRNNTFVGNLREGVAVLGNSTTALANNLFVDNVIAIMTGGISGEGGTPAPTIAGNLFWHHTTDLQSGQMPTTLPADNTSADPKFLDATHDDFALANDSSARAAKAGVANPLTLESPWPLTDVEKYIIPNGDTRDYQKWNKPEGLR